MAYRSLGPEGDRRRARTAYGAAACAALVALAAVPAFPEDARAQSPIDPDAQTIGPSIRPFAPSPGTSPGPVNPGVAPSGVPQSPAPATPSPLPGASPSGTPGTDVTRSPGRGDAPEATDGREGPPPDQPSPEASGTPDPNAPKKVKVRADRMINERATGITIFRGNVHVDYGPTTIDAEELGVDSRKQIIFTDARFTLTQPDEKDKTKRQIVTGTGLRYNYETQEATLRSANVSTPAEYPGQTIYVRAKDLHGWGEARWDASDAVFTTCEELLEEKVPHYHVESKLMQYYAGDKVVAWSSKIYINGRYMFWLPVFVMPLKKEPNNLNIGRNEVEGFYLRYNAAYTLPTLNNGFWLNNGRYHVNAFEKKPVGLGVEHTATWGYDAATYGFLYGLIQPDETNFLNPTNPETGNARTNKVKMGHQLFGLSGGPFQDRQWGLEHKHRLFGDFEVGGRFEDHNIYDPLSHNYRVNRQSSRVDLKDKIEALGVNYDLGYDGTRQRGNQSTTNRLSQSNSDRLKGNVGFGVLNTQIRVSSQYDRSQQLTREVVPKTSPTPGQYRLRQEDEDFFDPGEAADDRTPLVEYEVKDQPGAANTNITNTFNASTTWGPNTNSTVNVPYRINYKEPAPPTPVPPGKSATPAPIPSASPWEQQAEPQLEVTHRMKGIGSLQLQAQKFLDLTQELPSPGPSPGASPTPMPSPAALIQAEQERIRRSGRFDKLPELTLTSEPFLPDYQPFTLKAAYGRFFEYATFKLDPARLGQKIDRNFPGDYINRFNPEFSLNSKGHPIGFRSKLDFGGSGYRQFFYSTNDAQYSLDERIRLNTQWSRAVQTNLNYTNNITPDLDEQLAKGAPFDKQTNNSPFNQDRLSLSKQTRLTGAFEVATEPWLRYALRGGYDYINRAYDNLQTEATWRTTPFGIPLGMTLNGQYDIEENDDGGLKFERKTLDVRYLPKVPTYGIAGKWSQAQATMSIRSTPEVFGGAYGSTKILPGWQLDNQMSYDFEKGLWQSLVNRLYITFGQSWASHVQLVLGGYYDTQEKQYKFSQIGLNKDLHDFVLSFQFDRLQSFYSLSLTMVAFPSQPLNFTSNTFDRRTGPGGGGFGQGFGQ